MEYICNMIVFREISNRKQLFLTLCKQHHVKSLYAFGSSITEKFDEKTSDVDLLIELDEDDPVERGEKLISIWDALEDFFQRKVDLLTETSIRNPYLRKSIDDTKELIYDGSRQKVFV